MGKKPSNVTISGMTMPKRCADCQLFNNSGEFCVLTYEYMPRRKKNAGRGAECPLVEIVTCADCIHGERRKVGGIPVNYCHDSRGFTLLEWCSRGERKGEKK